MVADWLHLVIPILGLTLNVLIQVSVSRLKPSLGLLRSVQVGFLTGLLGTMAADGLTTGLAAPLRWPDIASIMTLNVIIYIALGYGYFHFVNLGQTARRVRLLWELYEADGGLTEEQIIRRYSARDIIDTRLGRMVATGQLFCQNGRYRVRRTTLLSMAKLILIMKRLILGRENEFDRGEQGWVV